MKPKQESKPQHSLPLSIQTLASKRNGGRVNFRGIEYQLLFAINKALSVFSHHETEHQIQLEGIEDVDLQNKLNIDDQELYQLKFTSEPMTASAIWKFGVLQNFAETYLLNNQLNFVIVTNHQVREAKLASLFNRIADEQVYMYWQARFDQFKSETRAHDWQWSKFNLRAFLSKIRFEVVQDTTLRTENERLTTQFYSLTNATHPVYLNALFYCFFQVSRAGQTIDRQTLLILGQQIRDQQALGPINPAIQNRLIEKVDFVVKTTKDYTDYFDGQPALPVHIAAGLPAARSKLEKKIQEHLNDFDVVVIKASSGQGKSTLAWRVGHTLHQHGQQVYQLHSCLTSETTGGLVDYLETRVRIGEAPVVVIDGLSLQHAQWAEVASRLTDTPVRFIVTTREEDWVRFGQAAYGVRTGEPINLEFNRTEANQLYNELNRHKRLHPTCDHWQTAWENVHERGLLMEYVYLLTRGEMLSQRLQAQLAQMNQELDGSSKLAVLRLISMANDIGIRLLTSRLHKHITNRFQPQGDLGEIFRQLEAEYYVQFGQRYVEGLHPVRSKHLTDLLHQYVRISETLLELASLLEPLDWQAFGKAIPHQVAKTEFQSFYESLIGSLKSTNLTDWSYLFLGIYQGEVGLFFERHRSRYDTVFNNGGYEFFAMSTIPYPHEEADPIRLIEQVTGESENPMIRAIKELPTLPVEQTSLQFIVPLLHGRLLQQQIQLSEMRDLINWFALLNLPVELPNDEELLHWLTENDPEKGYQIAVGLQAAQSDLFRAFANRHLATISHWLTRKTQSLSIEPVDDHIKITYLLTEDKLNLATEESVERIDRIHAWLPQFGTYETNALVFPFPNEELTDIIRQNGHKTLAPKMIFIPLQVKINRTWHEALLEPYLADSAYSWQVAHITLREKALACARTTYQLIERLLQRNSTGHSFEKLCAEWTQCLEVFLSTERTTPIFPFKKPSLTDSKDQFKVILKPITDWTSSFQNFTQQLSGLLATDKPDTRRVALVNIRMAISHLPNMQQAFTAIAEQTLTYFETDELEKQELLWYTRLRRAAEYYAEHVANRSFQAVDEVTASVATYWNTKQAMRYQKFLACLDSFAQLTGYTIYKPDRLLEEKLITHGVVGIEGLTTNQLSDDFEWIALSFASVSLSDIDFLNVIICRNNQAIGGFRLNREFLTKVAQFVNGEDISLSSSDKPYPIILNADLIGVMAGVAWSEPTLHPIGKPVTEIYQTLWKFIEADRLMQDETHLEKDWKAQQIEQLKYEAAKYLQQIDISGFTAVAAHVGIAYNAVFEHPHDWSGPLLAQHLTDTLNLILEM